MNDDGETEQVLRAEVGKDINFRPEVAVIILISWPDGTEAEVTLHPGAPFRLRAAPGNVPTVTIRAAPDGGGLQLVK